ncbi:MAG TPA: hypothetical protein VI756_04675 [Blastocatellia bacterium]
MADRVVGMGASVCKVISLESWKRNPGRSRERLPSCRISKRAHPQTLLRSQKQAAILRFLLSDETSDADLDAMIAATPGLSGRNF